MDKLKAMEACMTCPVDASLGEDETLWHLIMRYFGEDINVNGPGEPMRSR